MLQDLGDIAIGRLLWNHPEDPFGRTTASPMMADVPRHQAQRGRRITQRVPCACVGLGFRVRACVSLVFNKT